jgi:hypothetical protein
MRSRSLGLLRLPETEAADFQLALKKFGFESAAAFMRACAHTLIRHDKDADRLLTPLAFQTTKHLGDK